MSAYAFFECSHSDCRLRFPVDTTTHQGKYCPVCGGSLKRVDSPARGPLPGNVGQKPNRRIGVVLDNVRSVFNVGAIFRTSEGAGVDHLYLCGITPNPDVHPDMAKTALGAEKLTSWSSHANALPVIKKRREEGYFVLALERTPDAVAIQEFRVQQIGERPLVLVIGHERAGVDPGLLALCDSVCALPMVGQKASLNVAVAFGAAVYWLAFQ